MGNTTSCATEEQIDEYTVYALREQCKTLIEECEEMSSTLHEKTDAMRNRHATELKQVQHVNDTLREENEQLHTEHEQLHLEQERLAQKQRSDSVAVQLLNSELDNRNKTISKLHRTLAAKTEENDMIREELGDCVENIENMTDENYTLEQEHEELTEQLETHKETTVTKSEYEEVQDELEKYQNSSQAIIRTLYAEIKELKDSNDLLKSSLDAQHEVNQYNADAITRFEEQEDALKNEVETLKNKMEARSVEKRALVEEFNDTVDKLHIVKEDVEGIQKELRVERERQITLKKLNFTLKHELKTAAKTMKKERKKAIRTFIVDKMKVMCESSFQDECLDVLMDETWIPNDFERWFYEDIYTHIMMYVHNLLTDDKTQ